MKQEQLKDNTNIYGAEQQQDDTPRLYDGMTTAEVVKYYEDVEGLVQISGKDGAYYLKPLEDGSYRALKKGGAIDLYDKEKYDITIEGDTLKSFNIFKRNCPMRDGIDYQPGEPKQLKGNKANIYTGYAVEPVEGNIEPFLAMVALNFGHDNLGDSAYLLSWLADIFRNPNRKVGTALAITGGQGSFKSLIFETVGKVLGNNFVKIADKDRVTSRFNSAYANKQLIMGVEVSFGGDREAMEMFKEWVTSPTRTIELKGLEPETVSDPSRLVLISNTEYIVSTEMDDRRWTVLTTNPLMTERHRKGNPYSIESVTALIFLDWIQNPKHLNYLLYYFLNDEQFSAIEDPTKKRLTHAGKDLAKQSADIMYQWLSECAEVGNVIGFVPMDSYVDGTDEGILELGSGATATVLLKAFTRFASEKHKRYTPPTTAIFGKELAHYLPKDKYFRRSNGQNKWIIPKADELLDVLDALLG